MWEDQLISDQTFFLEVLNPDYEGLQDVHEAALRGDYETAKIAFAEHVRQSLKVELFSKIPYEFPENVFMLDGETMREAADRICRYQLMSVGVMADFSSEKRVDWESNPTYNDYKEWTWQLNRHNEWKILAHEYLETGDEKYAECFADLFASWVRQVKCPQNVSGYLTDAFRTIECGIRMGSNWPYALHAFIRSPHFTDDHILAWYKSVYEQGLRLRTCFTKANWLLMEMNGLAHIGILYPEFKVSEEWLDFAVKALQKELKKQFYPDGFQFELTTVYHDVSVRNYQRFMNLALAYDVEIPASFYTILEKATEVNIEIMMPNRRLPDINDGRMISVHEILKPKTYLFPDNQMIRWLLSDGQEGEEPVDLSYVFPYAGIGIYRDSWDKDATYVLFDGGPIGRAHQHEDKLNLLIYAKEKLIITEAGDYAYDESAIREHVLTSAAHNTILVDEQGQNRRQGYTWEDSEIELLSDLQCDLSDKNHVRMSSHYNELYGEDIKDVCHSRDVRIIKAEGSDYPIVVCYDSVTAKEDHVYTLLWHVDSRLEKSSEANRVWQFSDVSVAILADDFTVDIVEGQTEPYVQGFFASCEKQGDERPIPCMEVRAKGKEQSFISVFSMDKPIEKLEQDKSGLIIHFTDGETLSVEN
jgi:hypothetical protein